MQNKKTRNYNFHFNGEQLLKTMDIIIRETSLVYKDDMVEKFWNIKVSGKSFRVCCGLSGTVGTVIASSFETERMCGNRALVLIREKIRTGYTETAEPILEEPDKPVSTSGRGPAY